jgi:Mrp family chromosome partitioning ATPase
MIDGAGIRMVAEPVAAMARLTGHSRVLIAGCRRGDGASAVAVALALDLAVRLGVDTLLVSADSSGGPIETGTGGNGRPLRVIPGAVAHLWTVRCAKSADLVRAGAITGNGEQGYQDGLAEELAQTIGRYQAAVVDAGAVRLDSRMLAAARSDDPVLVVVRYGRSRRDELAATLAVINMAQCRLGGIILNAYETPAIDRLQWIPGLGRDGR